MAELLSANAREQLDLVNVYITPPFNFAGTVWNAGEYAWVRVHLTNSSGLPLRDVVVKLNAYGAAQISPAWYFDGDWYWSELEPGDTRSFFVRLRGVSGGNVHMWASISAEVVPYVTNYHIAHRDDALTAA